MDITIRQATEKDYNGLSKLYDSLNMLHSKALPDIFITPEETPQSLEYVRSIIHNEDALLLVAQSGEEIAGMVHAKILQSSNIPVFVNRRYVYIDDIVVKREYQRSSVGRQLMEAVEDWALRKGISQIELNVWEFNRRAMVFFDNLGYTPSRHVMCKTIKRGE